MDDRQQDTRSPQHPHAGLGNDAAWLERLVAETVAKLNMYPAAPTPLSFGLPPSSSPRVAEPSEIAYALPGDWAGCTECAECSKLTALQRQDAFRKRSSIGILPATGCRFCGLASKPESFTKPFCDFLTENPTIFHAVGYFQDKLNAGGFIEVRMSVQSPEDPTSRARG